MASSEQAEINSALSGGLESPDTEREVTETVPLKKNSSIVKKKQLAPKASQERTD